MAAQMLDSIYEKTNVVIRRIVILPGRAQTGLGEHRAVVAAMRAGDGEAAERHKRANLQKRQGIPAPFPEIRVVRRRSLRGRRGQTERQGPLAGYRVLEIGSTVAGPFCGRMLADFGAEVIKIEPAEGDPVRTMGKQFDGHSLYAASIFRNKKLISLDLHQPEGRDIVRDARAQMRRGGRELQAGHAREMGTGLGRTCRTLNPRLVMVRISGFGQDGPYSPPPRLRRGLRGGERPAPSDRRSRPRALARRRLDDRLHRRPAWRLRRGHGADGAREDRPRPVHRRGALRVRLQLHGAVDPGLRQAGLRRRTAPARA